MSAWWNWKVALASGLYRSTGFLASTWRLGPALAVRAAAVEFVLFTVLAGFTGAAIQRVRGLRPAWLAALVVAAAIPALLHTAEWTIHGAMGTAARQRGVAVSLAMTALAELFSYYSMRQGAMLTGVEGSSLGSDLARMPALTAGFLRWLAGFAFRRFSRV